LGLIWHALEHGKHPVVIADNLADRMGRENLERLQFAQQQQSKNLVQFCAGKRNPRNRRLPQSITRMQTRIGLDLAA
jgi:hypothetical protein